MAEAEAGMRPLEPRARSGRALGGAGRTLSPRVPRPRPAHAALTLGFRPRQRCENKFLSFRAPGFGVQLQQSWGS